LPEIFGKGGLEDGRDRADTLVHQRSDIGGLVGSGNVAFQEGPEGDAVGELFFGGVAEEVDNLARFKAEPGGIGLEGVAVLEEGLVDGFG
jgi:hypothetical protein